MKKWIAAGFAACLATSAASVAHGATILKLDLGEIGPDVGMNAGSFGTANDGIAGTIGDQNTPVQFTGGLDFLPDILTDSASFSLTGVALVGPAQSMGIFVAQSLVGGSFTLYDSSNTLLLSGTLGSSALTGVLGAPATGSVFSTSLATITGGALAPMLSPGSLSLSMSLLNVNGGAGLATASGVLLPFQADATLEIAANVIPEPTSAAGLLMGFAGLALSRRKK